MADFHIQPIIDLTTGKVCGGEVLWRPNGAPLTPELITELDEDPVTNAAVTQDSFLFALDVMEQTKGSLWLSINLSCSFLGSGQRLLRRLSKALPDLEAAQRSAGKNLVIEISEKSVSGTNEANFISQLSHHHQIAIDDFGVTDASIGHMMKMPYSKLKLDRSVVSGCDFDVFKQRFIKAILAGCHAIGTEVCAEGIETQSEAAFLKRVGIDHGQGWLWSKAVSREDFLKLAEEQSESRGADIIDIN